MKKIVKTLVASVAAILLLLSCAHISDFNKQNNSLNYEQKESSLCYIGGDWENS